MNGFGRVVEAPRNPPQLAGGFLYPYQFPEGSHASVEAGVCFILIFTILSI